MATTVSNRLSEFAQGVLAGLTDPVQKRISPKYFYDALGSALFEAITFLPEYGLTKADERLLQTCSARVAQLCGFPRQVIELGSGSGRKTRHVLNALATPDYYPIDISPDALAVCSSELSQVANVHPVVAEWMSGLTNVAAQRRSGTVLLLFLGSSIGNLRRDELPSFFASLRGEMMPGDFFLLGADLVKPVETMLAAYDDPTGVTAAFNLNLLGRMNRELGARFDLRLFEHQAKWNEIARAIEMHLVARTTHEVSIDAFNMRISFVQGESIWTESSHKFTVPELDIYAHSSGFRPIANWVDEEWAFAEVLWAAE